MIPALPRLGMSISQISFRALRFASDLPEDDDNYMGPEELREWGEPLTPEELRQRDRDWNDVHKAILKFKPDDSFSSWHQKLRILKKNGLPSEVFLDAEQRFVSAFQQGHLPQPVPIVEEPED